MGDENLFLRLGLALAIGFAVGLERGWKERDEEEGERTAGLRTFSLLGLLGGVVAAVPVANELLLAAAFVTTGATLCAFMLREAAHEHDFSATTFVAALLTFALGAFAVLGDMAAAAGSAVAAVLLLAHKEILHGWLARLSWAELRSGLVLGAMTFIALPLLPNRTIDPWGAFNPHELWLMTVLIAAVSFAGYAAVKALGAERGAVLAAAAGGMVSSTAVTLTMARMGVENPERAGLLAGSILVSGAVMIIRVLILVAVINSPLAGLLAPPLLAALIAMAALAAMLVWRERGSSGVSFDLKNPFDLRAVLRFGVLLAIVVVAAAIVQRQFGDQGLFVLSAISGLADVDAIALSVARLDEPGTLAVQTILIGVAVNSLAKSVYAWWAGSMAIGIRVLTGSLAAIAAGLAVLRFGGA